MRWMAVMALVLGGCLDDDSPSDGSNESDATENSTDVQQTETTATDIDESTCSATGSFDQIDWSEARMSGERCHGGPGPDWPKTRVTFELTSSASDAVDVLSVRVGDDVHELAEPVRVPTDGTVRIECRGGMPFDEQVMETCATVSVMWRSPASPDVNHQLVMNVPNIASHAFDFCPDSEPDTVEPCTATLVE